MSLADVALRFATDEDMLRLEPTLDLGKGNGVYPRLSGVGARLHDWEIFHVEAMNEIQRRMRNLKSTAEPMELGRLDPRSKDRLRPVAARFALHFLYIAADSTAQDDRFARKASYYWQRGGDILDAELPMLDYDTDNSGTTDITEKNQPFIARFIRG